MKSLLFTLGFTFVSSLIFGQQQPMISQYMLNPYYANPAYSDSGGLYNLSFLHRSQWSGYHDYTGETTAPEMQLLTTHINFDSTGHTVGALFSRDKAAYLSSYQAQLSYAYQVRLSKKSTLALGIRGGIITRSIDYDKYIVKHPDDELIHSRRQAETKPDVTLGLWFTHQKFFSGISFQGMVVQSDFSTIGLTHEKVITGTAGYRFDVRQQWKLMPTIQLITTTHQTSVQVGALMEYSNALWFGLGYRQYDALTLLTGFSLLEKKLRLNYAFDYTTSDKSIKAGTSHEIMISYQFGNNHSKKVVRKKVDPSE